MPFGSLGIRGQTVLVLALFVGSVVVLLSSTYAMLGLPQRELSARERLREAGRRLAESAAADGDEQQLQEVARRALADFPGVEGGFYLPGADRFTGYAFPTGPRSGPRRQEPPPLEEPYIRLQAQQSADPQAGEPDVRTLDVESSRVIVLTAPVGAERPARLVAWAMYRLVGPKELEGQLGRLRAATGLALGGLTLALLLTFHLRRSLQRQNQEQDRLREELRRAEHLAALGKLLAGVAHEVRNPLAGIRSTVQLWQRLPETARNPDALAAVVGAVDRLNEIVSRLLYFARGDPTAHRPLAVNPVVAEALDLLEAQAAGQAVKIIRDLTPGLPDVCGNAGALRQVFLNLATNALQAMPHGGELRCQTRVVAESPGPATTGGAVEICFTDTGSGISEEDRKHLFEPFFTTRPEGTGLGLAICREIVTQHGGQIAVECPPGRGVAVRLTLPASSPLPSGGEGRE